MTEAEWLACEDPERMWAVAEGEFEGDFPTPIERSESDFSSGRPVVGWCGRWWC
jgi:hypothetical protein